MAGTEAHISWASLSLDLLGHVMEQLSRLLSQDGPLSVAQAVEAAHSASPNRHWHQAAQTGLRLEVRCSGSTAELQHILDLAAIVRLQALHFRHSFEDGEAAAHILELLTDGRFQQRAGKHMRGLTGAPCSLPGKRSQQHLPLAAYPGLQRLSCYAPPQQQLLSLRDSQAWQAAQAVWRLDVCGRHYTAVRVLPPNLYRLSVSSWHLFIEPELLVHPAHVELLAVAVLLSEHVLPYPAQPTGPPQQLLQHLAAVFEAARMPAGHRIQLDTNMVCFKQGGGEDAKLLAAWGARQLPAPVAADGGGNGGAHAAAAQADQAPVGNGSGHLHLSAAAGDVAATLVPPLPASCWPAALGASGAGPEMRAVLERL